MMASLPEFRTTILPPFTLVSIDFVGPLEYLTGSLRKRRVMRYSYVLAIMCLMTWEDHLEIPIFLKITDIL
jgi:hypothetical protein